ncbi:hypothetical protein B2J89_01465 [Acidovorax sp. SRB_24]|nr:hypothetical protein [Acidovorax sp. SRB_24]
MCLSEPRNAECSQQCSHDTEALPPGGFYFAPGAIAHEPRRARRALRISPLGSLVLQAMGVLAFAGLVGFLAALAQVKGWPLQ